MLWPQKGGGECRLGGGGGGVISPLSHPPVSITDKAKKEAWERERAAQNEAWERDQKAKREADDREE